MKNIIIFGLLIQNSIYAACTSKDLTDPDYLKSVGKEKLIEHFKTPRDQDGVGWCGAYATSDSLSFAVAEPVSAVDVSINQYANERTTNIKLQDLSGISIYSATDVAEKNGYCPESIIPSDQTSTSNLGHYAILNLMEAFQKINDDYVSKGRPKDYCVKCNTDLYEKTIMPTLPNVSAEMIQEVLIKNQGNSLTGIRDLLNKLCEGKRVKVKTKTEYIYKSDLANKKISTTLDEALDSDILPSIGMNTSFFASPSAVPGGNGGHEMAIVARRMGANGKCEYRIRNSWGRSCSYYQDKIKEKCDPKTGSFWMDQDEIQTSVSDVLLISNPTTPPVIDYKLPSSNEGQYQDTPINNTIKNPFENVDIKQVVSNVLDGLKNTLQSIWTSFSNFFKY